MSATECCICLEATPSPIKTPCGHNYCNKCLTSWLLEKDSCPTCRHEIGDSSSHSHGEGDSSLNNINIDFTFTGDDQSMRSFRNAEYGLLRRYHIDLITDLIYSQINGDNRHLWATFSDPEYFEYNFRRKKMQYDMTCCFDGKYNVFVEIDFRRVQPFIKPKKRNQKWVFKSKSGARKMRNYKR